MNLFGWLILGHFVADWLLQSDWMALGKRQRFFALPGLIHYAVYTIVIVLIIYFNSTYIDSLASTLLLGAIVFVSHWLVDGTDLVRHWMRLLGQRHQLMVYIVIDQTLHLLLLGILLAWLQHGCLERAPACSWLTMQNEFKQAIPNDWSMHLRPVGME